MFDPIAYINEPRWQKVSLGLDRTRLLLDLIGRPQNQLRFVHVAGTNGKGSMCSVLASVLQAAGYRTGLFTSPYLITFEERIRVDGANIALDDLRDVTLVVRDAAAQVQEQLGEHPTEFELMTAVALLHFARSRCDVVVLEVGLGGRLDSTNVIESPEVCVIARMGLDHTAVLGTTLEQVAAEKAGIIKPGCPVVSWPQEEPAMAVVRQRCAELGCDLRIPDFAQLTVELVGQGVRPFAYGDFGPLELQLLGSYQPYNAALALEAVAALRERGWDVPDDAVCAGVAATQWPGRFQVVAQEPVFVVDGGHNPQGAQALADSLTDVFPGRKPVLLMGVLADKDYLSMLRTVLPLADSLVAYTPPSPRALAAQDLVAAVQQVSCELCSNDHDGSAITQCNAVPACACASVPEAVQRARQLAGPEGLVVAFGSLYSIADIMAALG
ncbi:MAG: folylpolyglutamate synthase/dihydrofolate synthase family protein [Coriobacteriia bacterium]|nr:folylpolyglutamate synthase/dihydrofolate synthase family protein [Coriobacteriia bacterium]